MTFDDEAGAVLHALRPVLVVALVPEAGKEAVEQVVGGGVDLDAVPAGRLQTGGAGGEPVDQLLDLGDGEDVRRLLVVHVERRGVGHRGCSARLGDEGVDTAPRATVVELREDGHAVLVDLSGELSEVLDVLVVVDAEAAVAVFEQRPLHGGSLGDDQTCAALGHGAVEGLGQSAHAVLAGLEEVRLRRRLYDAVLELHLADASRREQVFIAGCHSHASLSAMIKRYSGLAAAYI